MPTRLFLCWCLLFCHTSFGFELSGNYWENGSATFYVGISGWSPSGIGWNTAFKRAMDNWSNATSFRFFAIDSYKDPCTGRTNGGGGDDFSSVAFSPDVCGAEFNDSTLAITKSSGPCLSSACHNFTITQSDIVFKSGENWDIYSGPHKPNTPDFERVALHELGHALGLRHESDLVAIMQGFVSDTDTLQIDDINGANTIYGGAVVEPPATIPSIYGIDIIVPETTQIDGPVNQIHISAALSNGDFKVNGSYLDIYQFTFSEDSTVDLQLNATGINPYLYLVRISSSQDIVAAFSFEDNDHISQPIQSGTYWVGVTSAGPGETGSYDLSLNSGSISPGSSFQSFTSVYGAEVEVNPNPSITGELVDSDFVLDGKHMDLYQITVKTQVRLRFDLSSDSFDTTLILARTLPSALLTTQEIDESFLFSNDNTDGSNSRIEQVLLPGNYWLGITSADTAQTGAYQLETTLVVPWHK